VYEALPYTWGEDSGKQHALEVDGHDLFIGKKHFRLIKTCVSSSNPPPIGMDRSGLHQSANLLKEGSSSPDYGPDLNAS
jgi:hypothetical protein